MVQNKARDSAPFSRPYWQGERTATEQGNPSDEVRYHEREARSTYPITMGELLRRHCHIRAKKYFVAVMTDEGNMEYYAGPNQIAHPERLFSVEGFLHSQARDGSVTSSSQGDENPFEEDEHRLGQMEHWSSRRWLHDRHRNQSHGNYNMSYRTTKRPRMNDLRRNSDEPTQPVVQTSKKGLRIGDSEAVWAFYDQRFKNCQQTACKLVAKAWVKAVEPRKQSTHPYTGSVAPDWWPKPWGVGPDNKVRHKEPDHLYKKERVHLLIHILRLVIEPKANQHQDIQNLDLNVGKLEEVTMECLNSFFTDKENPKNAHRKPYLKEIFKVAKFEQRYKNGEIDSEHEIFVMADDKLPENYQSDDEDIDRDDEVLAPPRHPSASGPSSLERTAPIPAPGQDGAYMSELHPPQLVATDGLPPSHPHYMDGGNLHPPSLASHPPLSVPEIMPGTHDTGRRPSAFSGPEFHGQSAPSMYGGGWQQSTAAPANSPMYSFSTPQAPPQQPQGPAAFMPTPGVAIDQAQGYMQPQFDSIGRSYDPGQNHMYRHGGVAPHAPVVPQSQGYAGYVPHDDRHNQGMKPETSLGRGPLH